MPSRKRIRPDSASLRLPDEITSRMKKGSNKARSALDDITNTGYNVPLLESLVQEAPMVFSDSSRLHAEARGRYVSGYLVMRDISTGKIPSSPQMTQETFEALRDARFESLKKDPLPQEFKDFKFWVVLLHTYACQGSSRINGKEAHVNIANTSSSSASTTTVDNQNNDMNQIEDTDDGEEGDDQYDYGYDSSVPMDTEELATISSLPPPLPGTKPNSFYSVRTFLAQMRIFTRIYGKDIPKEVRRKVYKVVAYNARHLRWYPTAKLEKLWLTDEQVVSIVAALWRPSVTQFTCRPFTPLALLCQQVYVLCLHYFGIRAVSWIDSLVRNEGTEGRFLRWHHLTIRFLGYEPDTAEPAFLVLGSVSGTKHATRQGDTLSTTFRISSAQQPSNMNLAWAFVAMAIVSGVMDDGLLDVIESHECGIRLLNGNTSYDFVCKPEFDNCPVFLNRRFKFDLSLKHKFDAPPAHLGKAYAPMSVMNTHNWLRTAGHATGLESAVGSALFRRTWNLKRMFDSSLPSSELSLEMGHHTLNQKLRNTNYRPDHVPVDSAAGPKATFISGYSGKSTLTEKAVSLAGSVQFRPSSDKVTLDQLEALRTAAIAYVETESQRDADRLVSTFSTVNGGRRTSVERTLRAVALLLSDDDWCSNQFPHPFEEVCGGNLLNIVYYCLNGGPNSCPSCLDEPHYPHVTRGTGSGGTGQDTTRKAIKVNECFIAVHGKSYCCICWQTFPSAEMERHIFGCCMDRIANTEGLLTMDNFCIVTGTGPYMWQAAQLFICPFMTCIDKDCYAREHIHLKPIAVRKSSSQVSREFTGCNTISISDSKEKFWRHMSSHCFAAGTSRSVRKAKRPIGRGTFIDCGIYGCTARFPLNTRDRDGPLVRLCHLASDHGLPIFFDKNKKPVNNISISDIHNQVPPSYHAAAQHPSANIFIHSRTGVPLKEFEEIDEKDEEEEGEDDGGEEYEDNNDGKKEDDDDDEEEEGDEDDSNLVDNEMA